ncbi:MAG: TRAP transporter small permease [Methylobacteriaceae bacterium]|nr:TRAP transporter small permease [Methylobacteriaceae bacterium]
MAQEQHTQVTSAEIAQTFDAETAPVSLQPYAPEDWLTLAAFWLMVAAVIAQFVTRYVLNDSLAWTEEIAVYALVVVVFMGSAMCVRRSRHIHVDFIYRYLPRPAARALSTAIDVLRIAFFAYATRLVWKYAALIPDEMMTTVDLPKSWVFNAVIFAFALMTLRAVIVAVTNWRRGFSALDDPAAFEEAEAA